MSAARARNGANARTRLKEAETSAERLRQIFSYDADTGELTRRGKPTLRAGRPSDRYHRVMVDGVILSAHRVIWCMMTGAWPTEEVDHIDRDTRNNRWSNLRAASVVLQNRWAATATGASAHRGVSVRGDKYRVRIGMGRRGHRLSCGDFPALDEAVAAREIVESALWGGGDPNPKNPSRKLTDADASAIKALLALGWLQSDIASLMTVNLGRVSEIATGRKFKSVLPADVRHPDTIQFLREVRHSWLLRVGGLLNETMKVAA